MVNLSQSVGNRKLDLIGKKHHFTISDNSYTAGMSIFILDTPQFPHLQNRGR